jgi:small subunit ribosomal protein S9
MSETTLSDLAALGAATDVPATPAAPAAPLREREVDAQGRSYATGRRKDAVRRCAS